MRPRILLIGAGVTAALVIAGGMLALDAATVQTELRAAQAALGEFQAAVLAADAEAADAAAVVAMERASTAQGAVDGPVWAVARAVPRFGATARSVSLAVDLAAASAQLAVAASDDAASLVATRGAEFLDDGRIDIEALRALDGRLGDLPVDEVRAARDALAALPAAGLVGPTLAGRDEGVAAADDALGFIERTRDGLAAMSSFLGGDGPRTYLLAIQNPGELRGTGGLIAYTAEMGFDDGRLSLTASDEAVRQDIADPISPIRQSANTRNMTPVPRPDDFAARYDYNAGGALLQSVNLDPDLPTVAPVLLDLYTARGGRDLDGVVMVDPVMLAAILDPTGGPITVDPEVIAGAPGLPAQLTAANLAETLLSTTYDAFGGLNPARQPFEEAVTIEVLNRLTSGGWEPLPLATALRSAASTRHLQLYSGEPDEQAAFERLGVAGGLRASGPDADLLGIVGINAAPNKADVHVGHRFTATISLDAPMGARARTTTRHTELEVEVINPLRPDEHDTYIVGSNRQVPINTEGEERRDDALNRTWFQVWTPGETRLAALRDPVSGRSHRYSNIHDHRAFDFFLETTSQSTNSFGLQTEGEVELVPAGDDRLYTLTLWRQAKAIPDSWDLVIEAPPGWTVVEASISGGGSPLGLGALGSDGRPMAASVESSTRALVRGSSTQDAHITVRLRRG